MNKNYFAPKERRERKMDDYYVALFFAIFAFSRCYQKIVSIEKHLPN